MDPRQQRQAAQSIFMSSVTGLANTGAVAVAFFTVPEAYNRTISWVSAFAAARYGHEFIPTVELAWFVILALLIFFISRASVATLIVMGGLTIAMRLL